jgi:hypothetical protein
MKILAAAAAAFVLIVAVAVSIRCHGSSSFSQTRAPRHLEIPAAEQPVGPRALSLGTIAWDTRVRAWLPADYAFLGETAGNWIELEAALVTCPGEVGPLLLERYGGEPSSACKGLLAVVLSADPTTYKRILADVQLLVGEDWLLFRSLAYHALTKSRPLSTEEVRSEQGVRRWGDLLTYARLASLELSWKREDRQNPDAEQRRLSCSASTTLLHTTCEIARLAAPVPDPTLRSLLETAYEEEDDSTLIRFIAWDAIGCSATEDPDFARSLVRRYLESGLRSSAKTGLDFLRWSMLPEECISVVDGWARKSLTDMGVFEDAVYILGTQKKASTEKSLLDLYALTKEATDARGEVLEAMARHGGELLIPVAETQLTSSDPRARVQGLEMLARVSNLCAEHHLLSRLSQDSSPQVRHTALMILRDRNTWNAAEESALKAALLDSDGRVRRFAQHLTSASDRESVKQPYFSNWDWNMPDRGEESP